MNATLLATWVACTGSVEPPVAPVDEPTVPSDPSDPIETSTPTADTAEPPTEPPEPIDCTDACLRVGTDAGWAKCYSCQCKSAMDGWLPSPDELQCENGAEIVVYETDADANLTAVDRNVATCANPTLLYGTCKPGGRLGQLTYGDVTAKWICRRNAFHDNAAERPDLPFDDVGLILYNVRNGASCWFDDMDGTGIAGDNWPNMDLSAPDGDVPAYLRYFYNTDGESCTGCHDNDPFNYSPYLQSVGWVSGTYVFGGFSRVEVDGGLEPVDSVHLESPEVAACVSCHRITSTSTCSSWAPDSLGLTRSWGAQDELVDAIGDPSSPLWPLLTWMPYEHTLDPATWEAQYGLARDAIVECCQRPGVQTARCLWEPNP